MKNVNALRRHYVAMDDETATLSDLKLHVKRFCDERDWDQFHGPKDLAIGVATEAAELLEVFRFKSPEECEQIMHTTESRERVADEIADTLYFLLRMCQRYDLDISSELARKMKKNEERYPVSGSKGSNRKYDEM